MASYGGTAETTIYVGGLIEKVTLGATTSWKHYITGGSGPVAVYTRKSTGVNEIHYLTQDHLGSVDSVTDGSGTVEVRLSFASFGQRRKEAGWSGNPTSGDWSEITDSTRRGFTAHEMLDNLSLTHMNGRVYDPVVARFISADPYVDGPDNSQGYNRMSYVRNNPGSYLDPSGFGSQKNTEVPDGQNGGLIWQSSAVRTVYSGPGYQEGWYISPDNELSYLGRIYDSFSDWFGLHSWMADLKLSRQGRSSGGGGGTPGRDPDDDKGDTDNQAPVEHAELECNQGSRSSSYVSDVVQNFADTNTLPGLMAPIGTGFITAGATSQPWLGTPAATFGRWAFSGLSPIRVGPAVFSTFESGVLVGASGALNVAIAGVSFETGAVAGSMIGAIPTGSGNTIRDSLADLLFDNFGPDVLPNELACGW